MKKTVRFISLALSAIFVFSLLSAVLVLPSSAATVDYVDNSEAQKISATAEGINVELTWTTGFITPSYQLNEFANIYNSNVICVEKAGTEISWTDTGKSHFLTSGGYTLSTWIKDSNGYWQGDSNGANFKGTYEASESSNLKHVENTNNIAHANADGTVTYKYVTSKDNECLKICYSNRYDEAGAPHPVVSFKLTGKMGTLDSMNILYNDKRDALNVSATKEGIELDVEWNWGYFSSGTEDDKSGSAKYAVVQKYAGIFSSQVICVEKAGTEIIWYDTTTSHYLTAGGFALSSWTKDADGKWIPDESGANYLAAGGGVSNEIQTAQENKHIVFRYVTTKDNECIRLALSQRNDDMHGKEIPKVSFKLLAEDTPENPDTSDSHIVAVAVVAVVSLFGAAFTVSRKVRG